MISFKQGAHHHATVASIFAAPFSEILKPHVILQIAFLDLPLDIPRLDRRGAGARGELERRACRPVNKVADGRSEEHTSELQSLMRISYAVFCLKKKQKTNDH